MARAKENEEVGTMYTHAEVMVDTFDQLKRKTARVLRQGEDAWTKSRRALALTVTF